MKKDFVVKELTVTETLNTFKKLAVYLSKKIIKKLKLKIFSTLFFMQLFIDIKHFGGVGRLGTLQNHI